MAKYSKSKGLYLTQDEREARRNAAANRALAREMRLARLQKTAARKERIRVDLQTNTIVIDGQPHDVEPHLAQIMNALVQAAHDGHWWVTGPEMNRLPGCRGKKISREIKRVPEYDKLVMAERGKGFRLKFIRNCP